MLESFKTLKPKIREKTKMMIRPKNPESLSKITVAKISLECLLVWSAISSVRIVSPPSVLGKTRLKNRDER